MWLFRMKTLNNQQNSFIGSKNEAHRNSLCPQDMKGTCRHVESSIESQYLEWVSW